MATKLIVNGQEKEFHGNIPATLSKLLEVMDIDEATVVAEVDGEIVPRCEFAQTPLSGNQHIELVRFVGGG